MINEVIIRERNTIENKGILRGVAKSVAKDKRGKLTSGKMIHPSGGGIGYPINRPGQK